MSKIRIYELAKELGVDNRVVIVRAMELGLQGKSSHSNTLDPDEADAIRRAIIRQAVGGPKNTEVITTVTDKSTGTSQAVVERRQGDVIRRRRHVDDPPTSGQQSGGHGASNGATANGHTASSDPGEHLFIRDEAPSVDLSTTSETETVDTILDTSEPIYARSEAIDSPYMEPLAEEFQEPETAPVITEEEEVVVEESIVEPEPQAALEVVAPEEVKSPIPATVAAPPAPVIPAEPEKRAIGPRILGRIDLPVKRVIVRPQPETRDVKRPVAKAPIGQGSAALVIDDGEDDRDKKKGVNKKGRKREISRIDLVDYGGREARRPRPGHGSRDMHDDRRMQQAELTKMKASKRVVKISDVITVGELAKQMSLKAGEVIAKLLQMGVMATINQAIDKDTATIIADEFDYQVESTGFDETEIIQDVDVEEPGTLRARAPIVTVMGHVDHGKTSLLDKIRSATVAAKEHGGITQHIGAYSVTTPSGRSVAFIDTPGHAAFTAMRARGAQVTDIVVLVVAADDGVMPQTKEAINHAKAAQVPIIVAVNKMDKPDANPDRIKQQLAEFGLQPEDWGGDTMFFPVSALKGSGIPELLDGILLLAEVRELKANPERRAKGTVIESRQDRGRGVVATVLVQTGTLRATDIFVSGATSGRVRTMTDHLGQKLTEAGPSTPVEITGFSESPEAGDDFFVVENEAGAREVASNRAEKRVLAEKALATGPISLEEFARRSSTVAAQELNVILKADVQGSVEAVKSSLEQLSGDKVKVRVLHAAVGGINESDVQLAVASKAVVVGFGVRAEPRAQTDAERLGIELRFYRVIYELLNDIKTAMVGLLEPIKQEVSLGRADVREVFTIPKIGTISGCYVTGGVVKRGAHVRLLRDNRTIKEGRMSSLRRFKDDVKEVQAGFECGIGIEGYADVKVGDVLEVFEYKEIAATL